MPANPTRDQFMDTGIAAYKMFINALLDVTDNLKADGSVVPPPDVLRHDGDDPYLVVAADKGTATFSDIANGIADGPRLLAGRRFRLAAAASATTTRRWASPRAAPGKRSSAISARWAATSRTSDFTVVGVGDMSGDVFGNGMLLSKHIRLVAAFDHRHIFLDPNADAATSFAERAAPVRPAALELGRLQQDR